MRPVQVSLSSVAASAWIPVDRHPVSQVGYGVRLGGGAATYNVEYTYENVLNGAVPTQVFLAQTAQTTNKDGVINQPISAIRLNVTAYTSGTITMDILQGVKE